MPQDVVYVASAPELEACEEAGTGSRAAVSGSAADKAGISAVILVFAYKLSRYKGIPSALLWVLIVVLVYGYITSNTTTGRYFYAVGGNEKATRQIPGLQPKSERS